MPHAMFLGPMPWPCCAAFPYPPGHLSPKAAFAPIPPAASVLGSPQEVIMKIDEVLYQAHVVATGGRAGQVQSDNGVLNLKVTTPKELGGDGAQGTNPE